MLLSSGWTGPFQIDCLSDRTTIAAAGSRKFSGDKDPVLDLQSVWRVAGAGLPVIAGRGGLPITRNAQTVGAVGVSGCATDQEDEQCAKAGVQALAQSS